MSYLFQCDLQCLASCSHGRRLPKFSTRVMYTFRDFSCTVMRISSPSTAEVTSRLWLAKSESYDTVQEHHAHRDPSKTNLVTVALLWSYCSEAEETDITTTIQYWVNDRRSTKLILPVGKAPCARIATFLLIAFNQCSRRNICVTGTILIVQPHVCNGLSHPRAHSLGKSWTVSSPSGSGSGINGRYSIPEIRPGWLPRIT